MSSSPKAKDLTGSLVHYSEKKGKSQSLRPVKLKKEKKEREMAFDPFSYGVWCAVACLFVAQALLILLPGLF